MALTAPTIGLSHGLGFHFEKLFKAYSRGDFLQLIREVRTRAVLATLLRWHCCVNRRQYTDRLFAVTDGSPGNQRDTPGKIDGNGSGRRHMRQAGTLSHGPRFAWPWPHR